MNWELPRIPWHIEIAFYDMDDDDPNADSIAFARWVAVPRKGDTVNIEDTHWKVMEVNWSWKVKSPDWEPVPKGACAGIYMKKI